jgi:hypothetical protein
MTWRRVGALITVDAACVGSGNVVWRSGTRYDATGDPLDARGAWVVEYAGLRDRVTWNAAGLLKPLGNKSYGSYKAHEGLYERVADGLRGGTKPGDAGDSGGHFWDSVSADGGVISRFTSLGTTASP